MSPCLHTAPPGLAVLPADRVMLAAHFATLNLASLPGFAAEHPPSLMYCMYCMSRCTVVTPLQVMNLVMLPGSISVDLHTSYRMHIVYIGQAMKVRK